MEKSGDIKNNTAEIVKGNTDLSELDWILGELKTKIRVIGCGGAGTNIVQKFNEIGFDDVECIVIDTEHLQSINTDKKIIIDDQKKESLDEIQTSLDGSDLSIIVMGIGGNAGTSSANIVAEASREIGALTIVFSIIPQNYEHDDLLNTDKNFLKFKENADSIIVISSDSLSEMFNSSPESAIEFQDQMVVKGINMIIDAIKTPGIVTLDFADIKILTQRHGELSNIGYIGYGDSDRTDDITRSVEKIMGHPLFVPDIQSVYSMYVNVKAGADVSISDVENIVGNIYAHFSPEIRLAWNFIVDKDLKPDAIQTMVMAISN